MGPSLRLGLNVWGRVVRATVPRVTGRQANVLGRVGGLRP